MGARSFEAPGRINLIGEHTDYNDGYVLPAAIDLHCRVDAEEAHDGHLRVHSKNLGEGVAWPLDSIAGLAPARHWSDYVAAVAQQIAAAGATLPSATLTIDSQVPAGSGLSSSASLLVATALALSALADHPLDRLALARLCHRAETEFVGVRCGIMDQFISAFGQKGQALLLDCGSLAYRPVPLPSGLLVVIVDSMVRHELAAGEYNKRRQECEEGARLVGRPLRGIGLHMLADLEKLLPDLIFRRVRHVVTENQRVLDFEAAAAVGDTDRIGGFMAEGHRSLRDDYEVSCPELDVLVDASAKAPGVVGARMSGGGFGGSTVNLVRPEALDGMRDSVMRAYRDRFGRQPTVRVCKASDGAREL